MSKQIEILRRANELEVEIKSLNEFINNIGEDPYYHNIFLDIFTRKSVTLLSIINFGCGHSTKRIKAPDCMTSSIRDMAKLKLEDKIEELNELLKIDKL